MVDKQRVLIVDDIPDNIRLAADVLAVLDLHIVFATSGFKAIEILKEQRVDLVLMDINMPGLDGFETVQRIKPDIPVIFLTAQSDKESVVKAFEIGGVDYVTKPFQAEELKMRVQTHLALRNQTVALERQVEKRTQEIHDSRLAIIQKLGRASEFKDNETGFHILRMSHYSKLIASSYSKEYGSWSELIFQAAPMHDVGKIGIPDAILTKPGKLDKDEWKIMQEHPIYGGEIIGDHHSDLLKTAKEIALYHHEKYDGTGYPFSLKEEEIPLSARVVAIADVFDALTSKRPYKDPWSVEDAVELIKSERGKHFDPALVEHFIKVLPEIIEVRNRFMENGEGDGA